MIYTYAYLNPQVIDMQAYGVRIYSKFFFSFFLQQKNLTVMDIDSVGTFTMCHEALKYLKKGGPGRSSSTGGSILNISATLHYTASWYQIHVSAAKVSQI